MIEEFLHHAGIGLDVRRSVEWTAGVLRDPVSVERAKLALDTFVDPAKIDRVFTTWSEGLGDDGGRAR